MPKLRQLLVSATMLCLPLTVNAANMQLDINLHLTQPDAGGNSQFKSGQALSLHYTYLFKPWLALDTGLFVSDKTRDNKSSDVAGDYQANIQTTALLLGIKPQHTFTAPYQLYGRLDLMYWKTELEVEEYFGTGAPGGVNSADDNGVGYYISFGGAHYITDKLTIQLEFSHMKQLDLFEGKSSYPFDLTINSLSLGVGYRF